MPSSALRELLKPWLPGGDEEISEKAFAVSSSHMGRGMGWSGGGGRLAAWTWDKRCYFWMKVVGYLHRVVSHFDIEHQNFGNLVDSMDILHTTRKRTSFGLPAAQCLGRNEKHPIISFIQAYKK